MFRRTRLIAGLAIILAAGAFAATPSSRALLRTKPPLAHTGGFGEPTCRRCHVQFELNDSAGMLAIEGLPERYRRGERYRVTITLLHRELVVGGFELSMRFAEGPDAGKRAGVLRSLDSATAVTPDSISGMPYAHHTEHGVITTTRGRASWKVEWIAPSDDITPVVAHVAANAGNDDFSELGDYVFTRSKRMGGSDPRERVRRHRR